MLNITLCIYYRYYLNIIYMCINLNQKYKNNIVKPADLYLFCYT